MGLMAIGDDRTGGEPAAIDALFNELCHAPQLPFPNSGPLRDAPDGHGVYIICAADGCVLHVGKTNRARRGLFQRLRNHLTGHSSFVRLHLGGDCSLLRQGCAFRYLLVEDARTRALLEAHAIGPHELILLSDGRTLAVANGGIQTHPATGRKKLNLATMQPSLAYIDAQSGSLLHDHRLPARLHQASIRHIAASLGDQVAVVMQYEGPRNDLVPLVGFHDGEEEEIELPNPGDAVLRSLRHYCGAAAVDAAGQILAASAPRGGVITFWSMPERRYLSRLALGDGCGIAPSGEPGGFLASSGYGKLVHHNALSGETLRLDDPAAPVAWDNHLLSLTV